VERHVGWSGDPDLPLPPTSTTGTGLPRAETTRRYQLKNRLRSLLVRRFGDEHLIVRPGDDGTVSLDHRSGSRDACHAVVDELEPDARSWVRLRLDLAASPAVEDDAGTTIDGRATATGEPSVEALVGRARRAVQEYDYEAAERDLTQAFAASGGATTVALPSSGSTEKLRARSTSGRKAAASSAVSRSVRTPKGSSPCSGLSQSRNRPQAHAPRRRRRRIGPRHPARRAPEGLGLV
jgi:hypothetical protein